MPGPTPPNLDSLLAPKARPLVGVVHLPPLAGPDAPDIAALLARARADAQAYAAAGFDALLVENLGDAPYPKDQNAPHVAAVMGRAMAAAAEAGLPVGANVLRNDWRSALAACHAGGGTFIRVNVLVGAAVTDQGIIEGDAHGLHAYRRALGLDRGPHKVRILADVDVKHAAPLARRPLEDLAADTVHRAGADVLLVTGRGTGEPTDLGDVGQVLRGAAGAPVWVASGVTPKLVAETLRVADGVIVGSHAKEGGDAHRPVDPRRAAEFGKAAGKRGR